MWLLHDFFNCSEFRYGQKNIFNLLEYGVVFFFFFFYYKGVCTLWFSLVSCLPRHRVFSVTSSVIINMSESSGHWRERRSTGNESQIRHSPPMEARCKLAGSISLASRAATVSAISRCVPKPRSVVPDKKVNRTEHPRAICTWPYVVLDSNEFVGNEDAVRSLSRCRRWHLLEG